MSTPDASPTGNTEDYVSVFANWRVTRHSKTMCDALQCTPVGGCESDVRRLESVLLRFAKGLNVRMRSAGDFSEGIVWSVTDPSAVTCLGSIQGPLAPDKTLAIVTKLGLYLAALHENQFFCWDLSPHLVFFSNTLGQVAALPTVRPDLALRIHDGDRTYVAPESCGGGISDSAAQCDVYGLGKLTWTLLTGQTGRNPSFALPSDISPSLGDWDEFIDAACRDHAARRPVGMQQALGLLPGRTRSQPNVSAHGVEDASRRHPENQANVGGCTKLTKTQGTAPRPKTFILPRRSLLIGGALAGAFTLLRWSRGNAGATRGFADTIIRYPDRSYEGAAWKRIQTASALRGVMPSHGCNFIHFANVAGYDDDNLWITCDRDYSAVFFQLRNGHWEYRQTVGEGPEWSHGERLAMRPRLMSSDRFIPCVRSALYEITPSAIRKIPNGETHPNWGYSGASGVAIIAEDYYFQTLGDGSWHDAFVVQDGKARLLDDGTKKEAFIYSTEFNAPLEEYRVNAIGFPASFARGSCIGLCAEDRMAKIVEFRDGRWWDKCDINLTDKRGTPAIESDDIRDVFFGTHDGRTPGFAILCGTFGTVIYCDLNGTEEERSVIPRQESTTAELIRAWGVSPEKYWVMDGKGEVWERDNGQTRVVVRGLHDSDLMDSDRGFHTAWVSPRGNVFAATNEHLFKLS